MRLDVGWGEHTLPELEASIAAYTATVCARSGNGRLIGYASVFSDRHLNTMLGDLVVAPDEQRRGVGRSIMTLIETEFPKAPIYIKALGASRQFYEAHGYRMSSAPVVAMFKKPGRTTAPAAAAAPASPSSKP